MISAAPHQKKSIATTLVVLGAAACLTPMGRPDIMLPLGIVLALIGIADASLLPWTKTLSKVVMQTCVVVMGLGMNLRDLAHAGSTGIVFAAGTIILTFAAGFALGRLLKLPGKLTTLMASGTAICGGSAIAAVSTVIAAAPAEIAVATGTVFLLNAAGLYVLPWLGDLMQMSHAQFGTWCAISIHDVSSVVGAAKTFVDAHPPTPDMASGTDAWTIATAVKLSRALWIAPICMAAGWWIGRGTVETPGVTVKPKTLWEKFPVPLFILLFIVASAVCTLIPQIKPYHTDYLRPAAGHGMAFALFLIGLGISKKAMKSVGWKALVLGVTLWVLISATSLAVVRATIP
jgi:uncharacterized membrane protein YadS